MQVEQLAIAGVLRVTPSQKAASQFDWYRRDVLDAWIDGDWQPGVATTYSALPGQIRGLFCEDGWRILTCPAGRVALVAVDTRVGSPTFGRWIPEDGDGVDRITLVIPPGVAWGFQAVSSGAIVVSLHDDPVTHTILDAWDPDLAIVWPLTGDPHEPGLRLAQALAHLPTAR